MFLMTKLPEHSSAGIGKIGIHTSGYHEEADREMFALQNTKIWKRILQPQFFQQPDVVCVCVVNMCCSLCNTRITDRVLYSDFAFRMFSLDVFMCALFCGSFEGKFSLFGWYIRFHYEHHYLIGRYYLYYLRGSYNVHIWVARLGFLQHLIFMTFN